MGDSIARKQLLAAAALIRECGWFREINHDRRSYCMITALCLATQEHGFGGYLAAKKYLSEVTGGVDLIIFNDEHCESVDDAIAAFGIAADLAA